MRNKKIILTIVSLIAGGVSMVCEIFKANLEHESIVNEVKDEVLQRIGR